MSANDETTGAREGYRPCAVGGCTRWMSLPEGYACLTCAKISEEERVRLAKADPVMWRPDWTPPIAAPAAHVERRKGQRYRRPGGRISTIVAAVNDDVWEFSPPDPNGENRVSENWVASNWSLLVDAPPEPAKHTTPQCESYCRPGLRCLYCTTEVATPTPPAQEAPKAAPVCCGSLHGCSGPVLARIVGAVKGLMCESWMYRLEGVITRATPATGTPYAGPERLLRPQLAADWVEDCLPEAGR